MSTRNQDSGVRRCTVRQIQRCRHMMPRLALTDDFLDLEAVAGELSDNTRVQRRPIGKATKLFDKRLSQPFLVRLNLLVGLQLFITRLPAVKRRISSLLKRRVEECCGRRLARLR